MKKYQAARHFMLSMLPALLGMALLISTASAVSKPGVAGDWEGAVSTGSGSLRVVIHVLEDEDGKLTATMDSPDQGASGITVSTVRFQQPDLHFEIARFGCSYDGKMSESGSIIDGIWKQGGASLPLSLKRRQP
jgi:hypothetical protein